MSNAILNKYYIEGTGQFHLCRAYRCVDINALTGYDTFIPANNPSEGPVLIADANVGTTSAVGAVMNILTFSNDDPYALGLTPGLPTWWYILAQTTVGSVPCEAGYWGPYLACGAYVAAGVKAAWVHIGVLANNIVGLLACSAGVGTPGPYIFFLPVDNAHFLVTQATPPVSTPNAPTAAMQAPQAVTGGGPGGSVTIVGQTVPLDVQSPASVLPPGGATTAPVPTAVVLPRTPAI